MKSNLLIICFLVVAISCTSHKEKMQPGVIELNVENYQFKNWASLIRVDSIVQLKMNEDSLLSVAKRCLLTNNRIIFWDYKLKSVYVYDRQGSYLFSIGKLGGAEYECTELNDIAVSPDEQYIELLDATGILIFSIKDGRFIEKKKIEGINMFRCCGFAHVTDDTYLLFSDMEDYSIYKLINGKLEGLRKRNGVQLASNRFYGNKENCIVLPDYGNFIIDTYCDGKLMPKYNVNFDNQALPKDEIPQTWNQFDKIDHKDEYFKCIVDAIENEELLYILAVGPSRTYYNIYWNKKTDVLLSGPLDKQLGMAIIAADKGFLYALVYPEYLSKESSFYSQVQSYIADEEANPIIVKFEFYEK